MGNYGDTALYYAASRLNVIPPAFLEEKGTRP
jgi:hypothetical protein